MHQHARDARRPAARPAAPRASRRHRRVEPDRRASRTIAIAASQPRQPLGRLGPDIGGQPRLDRRIGRVERLRRRSRAPRRSRSATGAGASPRPLGRDRHRRVRRPDHRPAQIEAIAVDQQVQPRARPDLQQLDPRPVPPRDLQQPAHQRRRPPRLVGLRRPVEPGQQRRRRARPARARASAAIAVGSVTSPANTARQLGVRARQHQRVQPADEPQRQRVAGRLARPVEHPRARPRCRASARRRAPRTGAHRSARPSCGNNIPGSGTPRGCCPRPPCRYLRRRRMLRLRSPPK